MSRQTGIWSPLACWPYEGGAKAGPFFRDAPAMAIYSLLVATQNQFDGVRPLQKQGVHLKRGQLPTSERDIAEQTGLDRKVVRRVIGKLIELGLIRVDASKRGTIITVIAPAEYKGSGETLGGVGGPTVFEESPGDNEKKGPPKGPRKGPPSEPAESHGAGLSEDGAVEKGPPEGPLEGQLWAHSGPTLGTYIKKQEPRREEHLPSPYPSQEGGDGEEDGFGQFEPVSDREARRMARVIVGDMERALVEADSEDGAQWIIGEGWAVLMAQFGSWENLARSARHIFKQEGPIKATNHFVRQIAARLAQEGAGRAQEASSGRDPGEAFGL